MINHAILMEIVAIASHKTAYTLASANVHVCREILENTQGFLRRVASLHNIKSDTVHSLLDITMNRYDFTGNYRGLRYTAIHEIPDSRVFVASERDIYSIDRDGRPSQLETLESTPARICAMGHSTIDGECKLILLCDDGNLYVFQRHLAIVEKLRPLRAEELMTRYIDNNNSIESGRCR